MEMLSGLIELSSIFIFTFSGLRSIFSGFVIFSFVLKVLIPFGVYEFVLLSALFFVFLFVHKIPIIPIKKRLLK